MFLSLVAQCAIYMQFCQWKYVGFIKLKKIQSIQSQSIFFQNYQQIMGLFVVIRTLCQQDNIIRNLRHDESLCLVIKNFKTMKAKCAISIYKKIQKMKIDSLNTYAKNEIDVEYIGAIFEFLSLLAPILSCELCFLSSCNHF